MIAVALNEELTRGLRFVAPELGSMSIGCRKAIALVLLDPLLEVGHFVRVLASSLRLLIGVSSEDVLVLAPIIATRPHEVAPLPLALGVQRLQLGDALLLPRPMLVGLMASRGMLSLKLCELCAVPCGHARRRRRVRRCRHDAPLLCVLMPLACLLSGCMPKAALRSLTRSRRRRRRRRRLRRCRHAGSLLCVVVLLSDCTPELGLPSMTVVACGRQPGGAG